MNTRTTVETLPHGRQGIVVVIVRGSPPNLAACRVDGFG